MLVACRCSQPNSHTHRPQLLHQLHASGQGMQHKPPPELPPTGCAGVGPLITAVRVMLSHLNDARETLLLLLAIGMLQELMQTQSGKVRLPCCKGCAVPSRGVLMKALHCPGACILVVYGQHCFRQAA